MNKLTLPLAALVFLSPAIGQAGVSISLNIGLPPAPQMVVVAPGIQVVEGFQEEVFFRGGWYWCRRPNGWYRSRSPQARFDFIEARRVPGELVRMPEGHYRNWHHEEMRAAARREEHMERREDRMERHDAHMERREEGRERAHREEAHERREDERSRREH